MKRSERLIHIGFRCLCLCGRYRDNQSRINHFSEKANRLFAAAAGRARALEGGAS